jgi:hypothetical protein
MSTITNLQTLYTKTGDTSSGDKTIINHQTTYITKLQSLVNAINDANNGCLKSGATLEYIKTDIDNSTSIYIDRKSECTNKIQAISDAIQQLNDAKITFSGSFANQSPASDYNAIMENNKKIQDLRNELDLKLKDLNRTPDSRFQTYEDNYNYELMMNITWSILATSIIYYVFAKL